MSTSLILEGGGYRGQFTSGVLDIFMEQGLYFDAVYAVSAGSLNAMGYLAHQIGRANRINLAFRDDKRYMGWSSFLTSGSIVSPEFMYQVIQDEIDPFDYTSFNLQAKCTSFYSVVSEMSLGQPEYHKIEVLPRDIDWVRASATLPVVSKKVQLEGKYYLDGGITDAIPLNKSLADGHTKHVVVLTQHREFIKKPYAYPRISRLRYEEFPKFLQALETRHILYNELRQKIFRMEKADELVVVCPPVPVNIKQIEHGGPQLLDLYIKGRHEASAALDKIRSYLGEEAYVSKQSSLPHNCYAKL